MHRFKKECKDIQEKGSRTKKYTCEKSKANEICKNHIEKLDMLTTKIPNLKAKIKKRKADGKKVPKSLPKKLEKIKKKIITLKSTKIPTVCGHNDNAESTKIE
jgi:hypothetical protein